MLIKGPVWTGKLGRVGRRGKSLPVSTSRGAALCSDTGTHKVGGLKGGAGFQLTEEATVIWQTWRPSPWAKGLTPR